MEVCFMGCADFDAMRVSTDSTDLGDWVGILMCLAVGWPSSDSTNRGLFATQSPSDTPATAVWTLSRSVASILSSLVHPTACLKIQVFQRGVAQLCVHPCAAPAQRAIIFPCGSLFRYTYDDTISRSGSGLAPPGPLATTGSVSYTSPGQTWGHIR